MKPPTEAVVSSIIAKYLIEGEPQISTFKALEGAFSPDEYRLIDYVDNWGQSRTRLHPQGGAQDADALRTALFDVHC